MAVKKSWNKLIDIELTDATGSGLKIACPRNGRKPEITISGKYDTKTQVNRVEIRIRGFYTTKIQQFTTVRITAGYEGNMSEALIGSIANIYQESPGPDGVTVISCTTANIDDWLNKQIKLDLPAGFGLKQAITEIAKALGFSSFEPSENPTSESSVQLNTTAHDALTQMKNYFPAYTFRVSNNTVIAAKQEPVEESNEFNIEFLSAPPQYSGSQVTITAPWNPAIKVGDWVKFTTNYYQITLSTQGATMIKDRYRVQTIEFNFSTTGQENRMSIVGVASEQ